jgi:hypothetical protein
MERETESHDMEAEQKGIMEDSLTSVYLTHLLLKLQIAELDYREATEFAFMYTNSQKTCDRLGSELFASWSTVCRNGKALTIYFRDPDAAPMAIRHACLLNRRHYVSVLPLEEETTREIELDLMSIERLEVPPLIVPLPEPGQEYSLSSLWPEN